MATTDTGKAEILSADDKRVEDVGAEKKLSSDGELEANVEISEEEGRRIVAKVDYRLVPILALLYLVAFLDRSNSTYPAFSPTLMRLTRHWNGD